MEMEPKQRKRRTFSEQGTSHGGPAATLDILTYQGGPEIVVDSSSVYFTGAMALKVGLSGGMPMALASVECPGAIAIDSTSLYWADYCAGLISKIELSGGTPVTLASGQYGQIAGIAVDSTSVYWANASTGTVMKVGVSGGPASQLASGYVPMSIAVDSTSVFWADDRAGILKVTLSGGTPVALTSKSAFGIAVDSTRVYLATGKAVMKVALSGGTPASVGSAGLTQYVAVDSTSVYWTDEIAGTVMKAPK
jgi:hypothetical protein